MTSSIYQWGILLSFWAVDSFQLEAAPVFPGYALTRHSFRPCNSKQRSRDELGFLEGILGGNHMMKCDDRL